MIKYLKLTFLAILPLVLYSGCKSLTNKKDITEGVIEYKLSYPSLSENDVFLASMLPKSMKLKFKDNNTISELKTSAGVFTTRFITNEDERNLIHMLKMINEKYGLVLDSSEIYESYAKKPNDMTITITEETMEIAGYECTKAEVRFESDTSRNHDIYFTRDIKIKDPNWHTPYHEIDGVLMDYRLKNYNIEMRLVASQVLEAKIDTTEFILPDEYKQISKEEMEAKFLDF